MARAVGGRAGTYAGSVVFALIIAAGVATVLSVAAGLPYWPSYAAVAASEVLLLVVGNAILVRRLRPDGT